MSIPITIILVALTLYFKKKYNKRKKEDYYCETIYELLYVVFGIFVLTITLVYIISIPFTFNSLYKDKIKIKVYEKQIANIKKQTPKAIGIIDKQYYKQFSLKIKLENKLIKLKRNRSRDKWLGFMWTGIPYHYLVD